MTFYMSLKLKPKDDLRYAKRVCLKCGIEGHFRYLCSLCITLNSKNDSGMIRTAEHFNAHQHKGGKG